MIREGRGRRRKRIREGRGRRIRMGGGVSLAPASPISLTDKAYG